MAAYLTWTLSFSDGYDYENRNQNHCHEMRLLRSKYAKMHLRPGLRPDPSGELTALPGPLAGFGGRFAAERRRERKQRGREWKGREGRKHKGRGGEDGEGKDGSGGNEKGCEGRGLGP